MSKLHPAQYQILKENPQDAHALRIYGTLEKNIRNSAAFKQAEARFNQEITDAFESMGGNPETDEYMEVLPQEDNSFVLRIKFDDCAPQEISCDLFDKNAVKNAASQWGPPDSYEDARDQDMMYEFNAEFAQYLVTESEKEWIPQAIETCYKDLSEKGRTADIVEQHYIKQLLNQRYKELREFLKKDAAYNKILDTFRDEAYEAMKEPTDAYMADIPDDDEDEDEE